MLREMIVEKSRKYSIFLMPVISFLSSVLVTIATKGSITSGFLCTLAGAVSPVNATAVTIGGIFTYLLSGEVFESGFIICSLILITVGRWITREDDSYKTACFITFISMTFSGIVFGLVVDGKIESAVINLIYAIFSSVAVYFAMQSFDILSRPMTITADQKTLISLAVFIILSIAVFSGMTFSIINIGLVLSCLIILCSCRFFGCYGGVICGVLSTAGIFIGNNELGIQTSFFGVAGLLSGLLSDYSRVTLASVFSGTILLGQLATGITDISFCVQADVAIGGILFMLIPERLVTKGGRFCASALKENGEFLGKEMEFAAKSIGDVRKNIMEVMTVFESRNKISGNVEKVSERVCSKCRNRLNCWEKNFENINSAFRKIDSGKTDSFPAGTECISKKKVFEEFEKCKREEAFSKMLSVRLNENRNFLFSQMEASEDIVSSLSEKVSVNISKSMTATLCRTLERYEVEYNSAIVYYSNENRLTAEVYMPEDIMFDLEQICELLCKELGVKLEYSQPFVSSGEMRVRFYQQTKYTVKTGLYQMSAKDGEPSGDTCGYFTDGLGYGYAFLSDGMGKGSKAAADSQITAALFKRLIRLGMSCEGAIKMINSVLLTRSGEESFATLDIAKINLETGGVTLCKSGASATLIKYGGSVMMFSFASNPIGIIHDIQSTVKECDFNENNILVMTSDGVPESAYLYIKEQLVQNNSLDRLSENICSYSRKITASNHSDDITAFAVKLVRN